MLKHLSLCSIILIFKAFLSGNENAQLKSTGKKNVQLNESDYLCAYH